MCASLHLILLRTKNTLQNKHFSTQHFFSHKLGLINKDGDYRSTDCHFTVFELACATGNFTRIMLEVLKCNNVKVVAPEPLESMCEQFRQILPNTAIIQCPPNKIHKHIKLFLFAITVDQVFSLNFMISFTHFLICILFYYVISVLVHTILRIWTEISSH